MNQIKQKNVDVLIIGAGPSGSLAATMLNNAGIDTLVVEKQKFPRFSIGESLLPQSMVFLEKASMLDAVKSGNYQFKNGAAFRKNEQYSEFNFAQKFSSGPGDTFQVKRADFDKRLADHAESQGVNICYNNEVKSIQELSDGCLLEVQNEEGELYNVKANFVLDASGFGRVLPRLLDLEVPSLLPVRQSMFCHVKDNIDNDDFDRNKILISVHPEDNRVWFWLIPFSDGTCSLGIVAEPSFFDALDGDNWAKMTACIEQESALKVLLKNAEPVTEIQHVSGYSANVKKLYGNHFALLGNAGEFLDPVFSSGVTIAFKSADLATSLLIKKKQGEAVCWENDYAEPLMKGVDTFRVFVDAWYDGRLQDIIFYSDTTGTVRDMICSILAGYAWDEANPYVAKTKRRVDVLAEVCAS